MNLQRASGFLVVCLLLTVSPLHAQQQLEQDTISIKGNQALPKTLYIDPWKRVGAPLKGEKPKGKFKEEVDPLEPDLFQRELELHKEGYSVD